MQTLNTPEIARNLLYELEQYIKNSSEEKPLTPQIIELMSTLKQAFSEDDKELDALLRTLEYKGFERAEELFIKKLNEPKN